MFNRIASVFVLATMLTAAPVRAGSLSFNFSSPIIAGSTFDVDVRVEDLFQGHESDFLAAFAFDYTLDNPSLASFVSATAGPLFDGLSTQSSSPNVTAGVTLNSPYFGLLAASDVSGPVLLATLRFNALLPGTTNLNVLMDQAPITGLAFFDAGTVAVPAGISSFTIAPAASVPEPTGVVLVGVGLVSVVLRTMRRSGGDRD